MAPPETSEVLWNLLVDSPYNELIIFICFLANSSGISQKKNFRCQHMVSISLKHITEPVLREIDAKQGLTNES